MPKNCTTPGCNLKDFHIGPHSFELQMPSARCAPISYAEVDCRTGAPPSSSSSSSRTISPSEERDSVAKEGNKYQLDLNSEFMKEVLLGTEFTYNFYEWDGSIGQRRGFNLKSKDFQLSKSSIFYTTRSLKNINDPNLTIIKDLDVGTTTELVSGHMGFTYQVDGNSYCEYFENKFDNNVDPEVSNSQKRMTEFSKALYQTTEFKRSDTVFTLDGNMSNRYAYHEYFDNGSIHIKCGAPNLVTWELDPCVAFAQQLLTGQGCVKYTGADLDTKFGYGVDGNLDTSPPGLEYLICNRVNSKGVENKLITKKDCEEVVGLYLDYCGGPIGGTDYEGAKNLILDTVSHLPRLCVLGITMSKRQRRGLEMDSQTYLPSIHGFALIETFTDNAKVMCWLYKRIPSIPRVLSVKWDWWKWSTRKSNASGRQNFYKLVIRSYDTSINKYICYSVDDDMKAQAFDFTSEELSSLRINECDFKDGVDDGSSSSSASSSASASASASYDDSAIDILKRKEEEIKYERLQLETDVLKKKSDLLNAQFRDKYMEAAKDYSESVSKALKHHMDVVFKASINEYFEKGHFQTADFERISDGFAFDKILEGDRIRDSLKYTAELFYKRFVDKDALQSLQVEARTAQVAFEKVDKEFTELRKRIRPETRKGNPGKKRVRF